MTCSTGWNVIEFGKKIFFSKNREKKMTNSFLDEQRCQQAGSKRQRTKCKVDQRERESTKKRRQGR